MCVVSAILPALSSAGYIHHRSHRRFPRVRDLQQRPQGKSMAGLWELPGGKMAEGESPEAALIRELKEELGIDATKGCLAPLTFASHRYENFQLLMPVYACRVWKGIPSGKEGQALKWVRPVKMTKLPMPPADLPLIPLLRDFL